MHLSEQLTFAGSQSNTPSTFVAFRKASPPISAARRAAAVSVVKNGFPVHSMQTAELLHTQVTRKLSWGVSYRESGE